MKEGRKYDIDDVDLRVCQHVMIVGADLLISICVLNLLRQFGIQITDCLQTYIDSAYFLYPFPCRLAAYPAPTVPVNNCFFFCSVHVLVLLTLICYLLKSL